MMAKIAALTAFHLVMLATTGAHAQTLRCDISSKHVCEASPGCQSAKLAVFNRIDLQMRTFSRCDSKGCDKYDAVFSASGAFLNIAVPEKGLMAKLDMTEGRFSEVVTLAGQVYVSFGSCTVEKAQ
ncbi:hypothetical protein [Ensifer adhaerens]|jgi:hypothetical protein|uniref:hypothetical protein n=2 Tax=Ensifer adhaerens TaxID=106592 RepID=UPI0020302B16|nr:hypothetical protein [Ensifer adhaerens]